MPHLSTTPNGTPVDLDTARGQYEYVGEFLVSHGAPSTTLSLLEKLYTAAKPEPGQVAVSREQLARWLRLLHEGAMEDIQDPEEFDFAQEEIESILDTSPGADQPVDGVDICGHDSRYPDMDNQPTDDEDTYPPNSTQIKDIGGCDV